MIHTQRAQEPLRGKLTRTLTGRGCPRKGETVVVKPLKRQQPRTKADKPATTTLSRAYESLRRSFTTPPTKQNPAR